jgi:hypothetical protein
MDDDRNWIHEHVRNRSWCYPASCKSSLCFGASLRPKHQFYHVHPCIFHLCQILGIKYESQALLLSQTLSGSCLSLPLIPSTTATELPSSTPQSPPHPVYSRHIPDPQT